MEWSLLPGQLEGGALIRRIDAQTSVTRVAERVLVVRKMAMVVGLGAFAWYAVTSRPALAERRVRVHGTNTYAGAVARVAFCVAFCASAFAQMSGPSQQDLNGAAGNSSDWLLSNHDYNGQRFVRLDEINRSNVKDLGPVCHVELGDMSPFYSNPIVYHGAIYVSTTYSTFSIDATTCHIRWRNDWKPKARENAARQRGVAIKDGIVIRGTLDGYLLGLAADTGEVIWERAIADAAHGESFTMPPLIYENLVIIGPAGDESTVKGWIGAFRLDNGDPVWRFRIVPKDDPEAPNSRETKAVTAGGAVWTPISLDPNERRVYVGTGNPYPAYDGDVREGDNLYTNSLIVLDARTGQLVWHYQATPHDTHDWDLTQASPVFGIKINGEQRKLVVITGKDGLLRALDRVHGSVVYEVAVTRRENTAAPLSVKGVHACPGGLGGVLWNGPAFNPLNSTLFVSAIDWCGTYRRGRELHMGGSVTADPMNQARGQLTAIDASSGAVRWEYEAAEPLVAAVTATSAGLVFTGRLNGDLIVLDDRNGKLLYHADTGAAICGGIVTYQDQGKQYVAVASGSAPPWWKPKFASAVLTVFALENDNGKDRDSALGVVAPTRGGR
jgi:alcohol dehydrogenase (cytochrome c)